MKTNAYTVTIETVASPEKASYSANKIRLPYSSPKEFFPLAQSMRKEGTCKDEDANVMLLLGAKLLGNALKQNKDCPIFSKFGEQFKAFLGELQAARKEEKSKKLAAPDIKHTYA